MRIPREDPVVKACARVEELFDQIIDMANNATMYSGSENIKFAASEQVLNKILSEMYSQLLRIAKGTGTCKEVCDIAEKFMRGSYTPADIIQEFELAIQKVEIEITALANRRELFLEKDPDRFNPQINERMIAIEQLSNAKNVFKEMNDVLTSSVRLDSVSNSSESKTKRYATAGLLLGLAAGTILGVSVGFSICIWRAILEDKGPIAQCQDIAKFITNCGKAGEYVGSKIANPKLSAKDFLITSITNLKAVVTQCKTDRKFNLPPINGTELDSNSKYKPKGLNKWF